MKEIKKRLSNVENRVTDIERNLSKSSLSRKGKLIKCVHCDYLWRTSSKAQVVSCPSCSKKTPTKNI